ncbi:sensor histidine kinase [Sphingomonas morindae]|uniref:histidine kinase n=1 Tax=Sphingomonas morindae TaxID=1541170 RepID=A0ABY4X6N2_9SPHN|nr:HAMP domain-containing sensor histidine kinase [Sphingomonas morindae]USI72584.1 HAMP domain-containing histidine kinase [Sphingomonas morindae]
MSSILAADPRARAGWRWGAALAAMLAIQSLALAAVFWVLANGAHRRALEHGLVDDCAFFALTPPGERVEELHEKLSRDVHRERFLGLFDARGALIAGNIAHLPAVPRGARSIVTEVEPTELPGTRRDTARVTVCRLPDGTRLLAGRDLDDTEESLRLVGRSLLLGLGPGLALALGFGLIAGRRAARQVDTVRRLAERIVSGDLDQRLPVPARPDSFGLLCAHINTMLDRIQLLVADVRGVGDDIAHQLRTPLTRLRARVERGMRDAADRQAFATVAEAALADVDALLGIVAALLRIRELEDHQRRSRFAPLDLAGLVEDACDLHRPSAEDRGIALRCQIAPVPAVEGDASLVVEAISNLLDNAMKFGPPGGTVTVTLAPHGGGARLSVADQGAGVPPAERALVTQRFYRGRRDCAGAGLGLSLVKAIADLHGFALSFADRGSAVRLDCPAAR